MKRRLTPLVLLPLLVTLSACGGAAGLSLPQTLSTPNGSPPSGPGGPGLRGQMIPSYLWYQGHVYGHGKVIAHVKYKEQQPLPSFLSVAGVAFWAVSDRSGGPLKPDSSGSAYPAFSRIGTPSSKAIVASYVLVGRYAYRLYFEYTRE